MTPLKAYAKSRKITVVKLHALCETVLGFTPDHLPESLSDEQIVEIDAALAQAARQVAALPSGEPLPEAEETLTADPVSSGSLAQPSPDALEETEIRQVIDIVGETDLRRHLTLFVTHYATNLEKLEQAQEEALFRFEQRVYRRTGETFERMARNLDSAFHNTNRLLNPQTQADRDLLAECRKDLDEYVGQ